MGLFYRTIRMVENGIKPVYVFDGKPPDMKSDELKKRGDRRAEALKELEAAQKEGDAEAIDKFSRRTVKVTREHNEECKHLLTLMGVPYVDAPGEAEAQCAALASAGKVYGVGSEDMDTLTFGSPVLLRHLTFSEAKKMPIREVSFEKTIQGLGFTHAEFIDLCIMLGCDYCGSIRNVGPHRALQLMKEHRSIEKVLKSIDTEKYVPPADWPFDEARKLFKNPLVTDPATIELTWRDPDEEGIVEFLVKQKGFNEERVRTNVKKLHKLHNTATQGRLDGFFKPKPKDPANTPVKIGAAAFKRKVNQPINILGHFLTLVLLLRLKKRPKKQRRPQRRRLLPKLNEPCVLYVL